VAKPRRTAFGDAGIVGADAGPLGLWLWRRRRSRSGAGLRLRLAAKVEDVFPPHHGLLLHLPLSAAERRPTA
jgi:hypothetical protein